MVISQDILKRIILDQHEEQHWPLVYIQRTAEKELAILSNNPEIVVLTGMRRCGKSILLENTRRTHKTGNDYFFNFEDERLVNFSTQDFDALHQAFISLYGVQKSFYLDEIQNIPAWELFVRRMYNYGHKIYLTGSNANLFSEELGTRLTGRYISLAIYPISFAEFSQYHFPLRQQDFSTHDIGQLQGLFADYLEYGGIPAYLTQKNTDYLHSLYESILYRDIISRYKINNPTAIKKLLYFLASNCGKEITYSKLKGMINNNGEIVKSITTISDYCSHIENNFLCFFINRYNGNIKAQQQSPKKSYFIDHALARIIGFRTSGDHGRMLENIVFIELKRRKYEIYYFNETKECDFILQRNMQTRQAIQVCTSLYDPSTKQREISGLIEAMEKFSLKGGLILTENEDFTEIVENKNRKYQIIVKPIWKWLRSPDNDTEINFQ